jgi:hypothetical protein
MRNKKKAHQKKQTHNSNRPPGNAQSDNNRLGIEGAWKVEELETPIPCTFPRTPHALSGIGPSALRRLLLKQKPTWQFVDARVYLRDVWLLRITIVLLLLWVTIVVGSAVCVLMGLITVHDATELMKIPVGSLTTMTLAAFVALRRKQE